MGWVGGGGVTKAVLDFVNLFSPADSLTEKVWNILF